MESVRPQPFDVRLFGTARRSKRVGFMAAVALGIVTEVNQWLTYTRYSETVAGAGWWTMWFVVGLVPVAFMWRARLYLRQVHLSEDAEMHVWRLLFSFTVAAYMMLFFANQILFLALHPFTK